MFDRCAKKRKALSRDSTSCRITVKSEILIGTCFTDILGPAKERISIGGSNLFRPWLDHGRWANWRRGLGRRLATDAELGSPSEKVPLLLFAETRTIRILSVH